MRVCVAVVAVATAFFFAGFDAGFGAGAGGSGSGAHGVGCTDWAARGTGMRDAEAGERSGGAAGAAATAAGAAAVAAARSALRMSSAVRVAAGAAAVVAATAAGAGGGAKNEGMPAGATGLGGGLLPSGSAAGAWPHQLGYRSSMPPGCAPRTTGPAPTVCPGWRRSYDGRFGWSFESVPSSCAGQPSYMKKPVRHADEGFTYASPCVHISTHWPSTRNSSQ